MSFRFIQLSFSRIAKFTIQADEHIGIRSSIRNITSVYVDTVRVFYQRYNRIFGWKIKNKWAFDLVHSQHTYSGRCTTPWYYGLICSSYLLASRVSVCHWSPRAPVPSRSDRRLRPEPASGYTQKDNYVHLHHPSLQPPQNSFVSCLVLCLRASRGEFQPFKQESKTSCSHGWTRIIKGGFFESNGPRVVYSKFNTRLNHFTFSKNQAERIPLLSWPTRIFTSCPISSHSTWWIKKKGWMVNPSSSRGN